MSDVDRAGHTVSGPDGEDIHTLTGPDARKQSAAKLLGNTSEALDALCNSDHPLPAGGTRRLVFASGQADYYAGRASCTVERIRTIREVVRSVREESYYGPTVAHLRGCERRLGAAIDALEVDR